MQRDQRVWSIAIALACVAAVLAPARAHAHEFGPLGETLWAFGVAGATGCGPILLLVQSLFLYKWVRKRSKRFRLIWPWALIGIAIVGQVVVIAITLVATDGTRREEGAGQLAATVCGLTMLFLSIAAVLAGFRAAMTPKAGSVEPPVLPPSPQEAPPSAPE